MGALDVHRRHRGGSHLGVLALAGALATAAYANPPQMDPHMPGIAGMAGMQHGAKPAEAAGVGIVRAVDSAHGTITLQHQAIASIGWPAMTMTFKVVLPGLLIEFEGGREGPVHLASGWHGDRGDGDQAHGVLTGVPASHGGPLSGVWPGVEW